MFCKKCGAELPENTRFCGKCGTPVQTIVQPPAPQEVQTQTADSTPTGKIAIGGVVFAVVLFAALVAIDPVGYRSAVSDSPATVQQGAAQTAPTPAAQEGQEAKSTTSSEAKEKSTSEKSSKKSGNTAKVTVYAKGSGKKLTGTVHRDKKGYVIADSSKKEYSLKELRKLGLNDAELCIAWNEPFARQGYHFSTPGLRKYFNSCSWYTDRHNQANLTGIAAANNSKLVELAESDSSSKKWLNLSTDK